MSTRTTLLKMLADGQFHSGTDLGRTLDVSRAAVCKAVKTLGESGMEIHRVSGRGYRLDSPFEPLDRQHILGHLQAGGADLPPSAVEILDEVDSTSSHLLRVPADAVSGRVCLAESQLHGRGRRGNAWVATPYRNIMLSMAWRFDGGPAVLAGLSLAAGVAVLRALNDYASCDVRLKWPNDLLSDGRKLGGLLVEIRGEAAGPCVAVLGLGLNVQLAAHDAAAIDQPWADLNGTLGQTVDRNRLAALLIRHAHHMFRTFEASGLAAFRREWEASHHYAGKRIRLLRADGSSEGVVHGVDDSGALLIRNDAGTLERFLSGEISLRPLASGARREVVT